MIDLNEYKLFEMKWSGVTETILAHDETEALEEYKSIYELYESPIVEEIKATEIKDWQNKEYYEPEYSKNITYLQLAKECYCHSDEFTFEILTSSEY